MQTFVSIFTPRVTVFLASPSQQDVIWNTHPEHTFPGPQVNPAPSDEVTSYDDDPRKTQGKYLGNLTLVLWKYSQLPFPNHNDNPFNWGVFIIMNYYSCYHQCYYFTAGYEELNIFF